MSKYIILRHPVRPPSARAAFERLGGASSSAVAEPPVIEVDELSSRSIGLLATDKSVQAIAQEMPVSLIAPFGIDSKSQKSTLWGIEAVGAVKSKYTGEGVRVAVLDTGIFAAHEAFVGVQLEQKDFTGSGNGDTQGHGTHCAGTLFGRDVEGKRIGVAPGVTEALIGKVLGGSGSGSSEGLFSAMLWAYQNRAHVISMSLGFDYPGMVQRLTEEGWPPSLAASNALLAFQGNMKIFDAMMQFFKTSAFGTSPIVVAAAGNESRRDIDQKFRIAASLPAATTDVFSVAALQLNNKGMGIAPFSNTMAMISAPGVDILSAKLGGGLVPLSGTSMACPHVAGAAALWLERLRSDKSPSSATHVGAMLLANARRDVIDADLTPQDIGSGLVSCP